MYAGVNTAPPPELYGLTAADLRAATYASLRWALVERFGWTLAQVDGLGLEDLQEFLQIEEGKNLVRETQDRERVNTPGRERVKR